MERLVAAGDEEDLLDGVGDQFLDDVLHDRLAPDRQHLLGLGLGGGQKPRAEAGHGHDSAVDHLTNIQPCVPGGWGAASQIHATPAWRHASEPRGELYMRRLAFLIVAAQLLSLAQIGPYPGGTYPPGRYPGPTGGGGLPLPLPRGGEGAEATVRRRLRM